jgi:hypothetical protein
MTNGRRKSKAVAAAGGMSDVELADAIAAERGKLNSERQVFSEKISGTVRSVSFGVLAIVWLLLNGTEDKLSKTFGAYSDNLLAIAALCVIALLLDFIHLRSALAEIDAALKDSEDAEHPDEVGYDDDSVYRWISNTAFRAKVWAVPIAAVWLLLVIFRALTGC